MERWDEIIQEDHQALASQVGAMEAALTIDVGPEDRRVVLSWIIRTLWPALELHFRKEERVLFPVLGVLLGREAGALVLLREQLAQLRHAHRRLAEFLQDRENLNWQGIQLAVHAFSELLEDHEKKTQRLLLDVLEFNLKPQELKGLAEELTQVAQKAYTEEGWPRSHGTRPSPKQEGAHV